MIHRTDLAWQALSWQQQLADAFTDPNELLRYLEIESERAPGVLDAQQKFNLRVPRRFAERMEKGNPDDPLLHQVLPLQQEMISKKGFTTDPVSDLEQTPLPGVLHKYHGRALIITTGACGINCRYCFRRHFPYRDNVMGREKMTQILSYLEKSEAISEVILSGGDPLMLSDSRLAELGHGLEKIPHIRRLRIHTRLAVVLPERITPELIRWLAVTRLKPILVMHANHSRELGDEHSYFFTALRESGITLLNQSVLLRRVNDSAQELCELSEALFSVGVLPYYLHQLDKVAGAAHFEVPDSVAVDLHRQISARLPGYLVPKLVRERAGAGSKISL